MTDENAGVVYLLHFSRPYKHARHYVGFCERYEGLESRFAYHSNGHGSKLIRALMQSGGNFQLVRLWRGTRHDERRLKRGSHSATYCPICAETPRTRRDLVEIAL